MITGELTTMPLADLLQWAASANKRGLLTVEHDELSVTMSIADRRIVGGERPGAVPSLGTESPELDAARTQERLLDLFLLEGGRFHLYEEDSDAARMVPLDLHLQSFVMEGMQHKDDWPRLDALYAAETSRVCAAKDGPARPLPVLSAQILSAAARRPSLADLRTGLGVSRPALLRRVHELCLLGVLSVEGAVPGSDPIDKLITQTLILMRERQFHEAGIVLTALFEQDPTDPRIRWLRAVAEQREVAALYEVLDPLAVAARRPAGTSAPPLTAAENELLGRVNGHWDVATLVLASPLREVETLKTLRKLLRAGLVTLGH